MIELSAEEQALLDSVIEETHKEIPENSKSLLVDETTSRFSSAIWYEKIQEKTVVLAGIGGIGSYIAFLLSRIKPKALYMYDPDIVETGNMSGQLYSIRNVGKKKVTAMSDMVKDYSNYFDLFTIEERFTDNSEASDIMICGFDNMKARKCFFRSWYNNVLSKPEEERKNCLFIDGRLAAEEFQIFCLTGNDDYNITNYADKWLFTDKEADETICSYKQTSFCANMIASYMVNLFVNFVANQCNPIINRDLPFFTTYNAETMFLKTEA